MTLDCAESVSVALGRWERAEPLGISDVAALVEHIRRAEACTESADLHARQKEAIVAVGRGLHWQAFGTGAPLAGPEYDDSVWKAKIAVNTMTALGWRPNA